MGRMAGAASYKKAEGRRQKAEGIRAHHAMYVLIIHAIPSVLRPDSQSPDRVDTALFSEQS